MNNVIEVNEHIKIHCSDKKLYEFIKKNYVEDVTDPKNEQLLDDLSEMAGEGVVDAYLDYDEDVNDWYVDRTEVK
jgi:hypothetical protein